MKKITEKQILEGNKLIAEFMGWRNIRKERPELGFNYDIWQSFRLFELGSLITGIKQSPLDSKYEMVDKLYFHSDWNWLMSVVEKIENCFDSNIQFDIKGNGWVLISLGSQYAMAFQEIDLDIEVREATKIESVYCGCIEFIKWHNKFTK